jgi:cell division protease FtsH
MPQPSPPTTSPPDGRPPLKLGGNRFSWQTMLVLVVMLGAMWLWKSHSEGAATPTVDYSTFYGWLQAGRLKAVKIEGTGIIGELQAPEAFEAGQISAFHTVAPPADEALLPLLRAKGVRIQVSDQKEPFGVQLLLTLLPWALIVGAWFWMSRRAQSMMAGGGPLAGLTKGRAHKFEKSAAVDVTFADIAGLKAAKQDLQEIVQFLKEPERFRRLGGKAPRGVLLVGPPGTGKTLLARAVAGESGVPFYSITASEFVEMFVGLGAARVRELFQEAKKAAPAIVFIDEIDAVGRARGAGLGASHDEREQTLNQLLAEMDGFDRTDLVVVIAATNRPDVLDPALLRPGRFDRRVVVDRPEMAARRSILEVHTKGKPLAPDVDLQSIAANTPGFSGADLANLANEAALHATRTSRDTITAEDFAEAFDKIVLGDPRETKLDAGEKRRVAVHEAGHALCAHLSAETEPLHRITIIPRGLSLGATQQTPGEDRHLATRPQLAARLRVLMGGYAAEQLVLGAVSSGAEDDLRQATDIAAKMVAHYGMSEKLGPVYFDHRTEHPFLGQRIATDGGTSQATIAAIEDEARRLLTAALEEATKVLSGGRPLLERLVSALFERETLEREELRALLGPSPARHEEVGGPAPLVVVGARERRA